MAGSLGSGEMEGGRVSWRQQHIMGTVVAQACNVDAQRGPTGSQAHRR